MDEKFRVELGPGPVFHCIGAGFEKHLSSLSESNFQFNVVKQQFPGTRPPKIPSLSRFIGGKKGVWETLVRD